MSSLTTRPTVPALEKRLISKPIKVLDHGFVRLIDYMGDDASIVQAARVSYGKGTKGVRNDRGLIRYLMRHRHSTPFEMCEIKFHIKLPIFVARQWIRHRTANVNEYSARYSRLAGEFYLPEAEKLAVQSTDNQQGRGNALPENEAEDALNVIQSQAESAYEHYERLLNEDDSGEKIDKDRQGLSREIARSILPVNFYTEWYWKIDLHNLLHFIQLRADSHAQWEIRVYAEVIEQIVRDWVPIAYEAFLDYRKDAQVFSEKEIILLRKKLAGESVTEEESGLSAREWLEFAKKLDGNRAPESSAKCKGDAYGH